jgi:hypothetical protein
MQDTITREVEKVITGAGLAMAQAHDWPNRGTLHAIRGVETVLAVGYDFQHTYATLSLSGPAAEQAPFDFLAGQDDLRQNRVCRGILPLVHITPGAVEDRSGLTIQFHYLEYAKPGAIREFLDVVRRLLPPPQDSPGTEQMIRDIASREGWTDATLLAVLIDYLASQHADDALRSYLEDRADV